MARVDKKPCYLGDTRIDMIAASQVAVLPGSPAVKEWVKANNSCPTLFEKWRVETEASRAAIAHRELDEDYSDPDDMSPVFLHNRKMYNALARNADIHNLNQVIWKLKLNCKLMSQANWECSYGALFSHIILDEINFKSGCVTHLNTTHSIVDSFLQLTGVSNCVSRNWVLRAKGTNSALGNLTLGAERAILAYHLMEFWFKVTKDGRFGRLLAEMEQLGSVDFSKIDIDEHALPDLEYLPGRKYSDKSIRCWKYCSKLYIIVKVRGYRYGYFLGRDHIINLIDRLKSIANVRSFMRVYSCWRA